LTSEQVDADVSRGYLRGPHRSLIEYLELFPDIYPNISALPEYKEYKPNKPKPRKKKDKKGKKKKK
jgi:hypothetical protein